MSVFFLPSFHLWFWPPLSVAGNLLCVRVKAHAPTFLVCLCVQTKIIQPSAWECIHTLRLACAKLCIGNVQEGRCLCRRLWKGNMNLSVCSPHALGARGRLLREKDRTGAFKSPPALSQKPVLLLQRSVE